MPRRIDLSTVSPEHAARLLRQREEKRREYERRKDVLLARYRVWAANNPDKVRAVARAWRETNPERKAATRRASYDRNRDAVLARQRERDQNLCDATVKSRFCRGSGLQSKDVPSELVPALRSAMLVRRALRAEKGTQ